MRRLVATAGLCAGVLLASAISTTPVAGAAPATGTELAGKTVFLDPGHQGTAHTENLSKQVPDGRGGTKDCQTTGMTALGGTPEHTITWNVAQLVKSSLESVGAKVVMSRSDDSGWGGCVDDRAKAANASGAQVAVSIHADSTATGSDPQNHGFHVIVPTLPIPDATANQVQTGAGRTASTDMRDAYEKAGFTGANYAGVKDGIQERSDIAGPALTTVPDVFLEMGNGANPDDAKILESTEGQVKHAIAITTGIVDFLLTGTPAVAPSAPSPSASAPATTAPTATTPPTATAPPAAAVVPSTPAAAGVTSLSSGLSQQLAVLTPLLDSFGLTGIDRLLTDRNVNAVITIVSTLFTKLLSSTTSGG